jgi:acyl carrier protein
MQTKTQDQILEDLIAILEDLSDEWECSDEITMETSFLDDLGFESIDIVAFGTAIEEHYQQTFPFAEYLAEVGQREELDIKLGEVVEFVHKNLNGHAA